LTYRIEFTPKANREIKKLPHQVQDDLREAISALGNNPRPPRVEKMKGYPWFKIRVGDYRVVYEVLDKILLVLIIRVGDRKEVYRNL
jgi:mRNA interferase RelE/StbE